MISRVLIQHYTENFTNEIPFHKIVYILRAVWGQGCIAGPASTFIMRHFVALCANCPRLSKSLAVCNPS